MPLNRNKVLIIGDNAVSLYLIKELLADEHLDVATLRQSPGTIIFVKSIIPDLILLDSSMSASSDEMIREALGQDEETRRIPILLCSSGDGDRLRKCVRRYRTSGCIGKSMTRFPDNDSAKHPEVSG